MAARGEGIICPHCKTFAPIEPGGKARCPQCGGEIAIEELQVTGPPLSERKHVPKGPTRIPSSRLGKDRSQ